MDQIGLMKLERVQYDQTLDALHVGLGNTFAEIQEKYKDLLGEAMQESEADFQEYMTKRKGASLAASGQTGRSIDRISTVELGQYLAKGSRKAYQLTRAKRELDKAAGSAAAQARTAQLQAFAKQNVVRSPDLAPPKPVMRDVRNAAFMDALKITSSIIGITSDVASIGASIKEIQE